MEGPVYQAGQIFDPIRDLDVFSVGFDATIGAGTASCSTSLMTIVSPDDVYVDVDYSGASNGSDLAPFSTFNEAYDISKELTPGQVPKITLRASQGSEGDIVPQVYHKKVVITADSGPVTLRGY